MAERTEIQWTDATVNFWWGCTKVSPGCEHCYAEAHDKRFHGNHWGKGIERKKIKGAKALIHKLHHDHVSWSSDYHLGLLPDQCGPRRRVFVQSMADLFDPEVPIEWFTEAWILISHFDKLDYQIVTKRIGAVEARLNASKQDGRWWPRHVGLMITVTNQAEADRDIPTLLRLKAKLGIPWVGVSIEPMLGPIDLTHIKLKESDAPERGKPDVTFNSLRGWYGTISADRVGIDWVICGGESGTQARTLHPDWVRALRDQCAAASVPFFFKQWGDWLPTSHDDGQISYGSHERFGWQVDTLEEVWMYRVGKKRAGRLLDGVEHNAFPEVRHG